MIRHLIAAIALVLAGWAFWYMYQFDQKAERFKHISELIQKTKPEKVKVTKHTVSSTAQKVESAGQKAEEKEDEAAKKLKALRDRAGNAMAFKVSPLYKQKCSSCHGVNGEGIIGPKLVGIKEAEILKSLEDFKSGKRKNYVMYGLLAKMPESDLKALSKEISTFAEKMKAAAK